jgi:hypothetical protein
MAGLRGAFGVTAFAGLLFLAVPALGERATEKKDRAPAPTAQNQPVKPAPAPVPAGTAARAPGADEKTGDVVEGFRSAKFGMNEAEIRAAIAKDFGSKPDAIRAQENQAELTRSLVVTVPDLLANGGTAEVSYVMGYKSKSLIQVASIWSKATDPALTPERLFSNANILRAHFMSEGFKPETVAINTPVNGGVLMFRGSDAKDRSAILLLQGTFETKESQRILTPTALLLFYLADAKSPDVFKLPPGQF